jgi:hypothetical protein
MILVTGFMKKFKKTRLLNFRGFHSEDCSIYEFWLWHFVAFLVNTNVSEKYAASFFKIEGLEIGPVIQSVQRADWLDIDSNEP